jgi:acetate---CoA ligase (ADP-forming)
LTNSGGPGIVAADAAIRHGLELPLPTESQRAKLARLLSPSASIANPVDMTADAKPAQIVEALRILLDAPGTDGVMAISTPTGTLTGEAVARAILEAHAHSPKAVAACLFGLTDLSEAVGLLESGGVPSFTFPEEAVQGLGSLARYRSWLNRPRTEVRKFPVDLPAARAVLTRARRAGATVLPEYAARELLEAFGIRFAASRRARTPEEAVAAAEEVGYPVVLKVASPDISHKTEVGGVILHLEDAPAVRTAVERMGETLRTRAPEARVEGFEVEAEIRGGKEVLIGLQRDPGFGPIVVFGLGGIYVEVLRDVTFRLAPVRSLSARHMIESVKAFPLLQGVRGEPPSDLDALAEAIERVSQLAATLPEVAELDLNPLIVRGVGAGVVAVDARVVLASPSTPVRSASAARSSTASPRRRARGGRTRPPR